MTDDIYYQKYKRYKQQYLEQKFLNSLVININDLDNLNGTDLNNLEGGFWPFTSKQEHIKVPVIVKVPVVSNVQAVAQITENKPTVVPTEIKESIKDLLVKSTKGKPAINIDNLRNPGHKKRLSAEIKSKFPGLKKLLSTLLKWGYRVTKLGASATGTVVSFGEGGDTIPDLLFLAMDSAFLSANLVSLVLSAPQIGKPDVREYMKYIYDIQWTGDPYLIREQTQHYIALIRKNDSNADQILNEMCNKFAMIIDSLAAVVGSVISLFIPDDAGISRFLIETIISGTQSVSKSAPFTIIAGIYNLIPQAGKNILASRENLVKFLSDILLFVQRLFPETNQTFWENLKRNVKRMGITQVILPVATMLLPGGVFIAGPIIMGAAFTNIALSFGITGNQAVAIIKDYVEPHIEQFADIILKSMSLTFSALIFLESCGVTQIQEVPAQEVTTQEIPIQEVPVQGIPIQEVPVQGIPIQEVPIQIVPIQQVPTQ